MFIGEFASLAGVYPKTIRYYESIGILPVPYRKGAYRFYDATYLETVIQIKRAKDFGFSLSEIKSFIKDADIKRGLPAATITTAIQVKLCQIRSEITELYKKEALLKNLQTEMKKSTCKLDSAL